MYASTRARAHTHTLYTLSISLNVLDATLHSPPFPPPTPPTPRPPLLSSVSSVALATVRCAAALKVSHISCGRSAACATMSSLIACACACGGGLCGPPRLYTRRDIRTHARTHARMRAHTCMHDRSAASAHAHTRTNTHTHTHAHARTRTDAHAQEHSNANTPAQNLDGS